MTLERLSLAGVGVVFAILGTFVGGPVSTTLGFTMWNFVVPILFIGLSYRGFDAVFISMITDWLAAIALCVLYYRRLYQKHHRRQHHHRQHHQQQEDEQLEQQQQLQQQQLLQQEAFHKKRVAHLILTLKLSIFLTAVAAISFFDLGLPIFRDNEGMLRRPIPFVLLVEVILGILKGITLQRKTKPHEQGD